MDLQIRKYRRNMYGERISFESGKVKYTDYATCKVGEPIREITSFVFEKNKVYVEYRTITWPWKDKEWVLKKREFKILKWSDDGIVLR